MKNLLINIESNQKDDVFLLYALSKWPMIIDRCVCVCVYKRERERERGGFCFCFLFTLRREICVEISFWNLFIIFFLRNLYNIILVRD